MSFLKKAAKSISSAVSSIGGGGLVGDSKDAGVLGVGQYKADAPEINANAFGSDKSQSFQRALSSQMAADKARSVPTATAAKVGNANTATAATIDQKQQAQFRAGQTQLAQQLQDQAAGKGPSLAQSQLRQATDRNIAQAMALAASQRGQTAGSGLRQVAQQTSAANQQAAQQSADLRMQEQMAARSQLGSVLDSARGQDIGLASNQAQLNQETSLANQAAKNQFQLSQAQLNQEATLANQRATLEQTSLNDAQTRFYNDQMAAMGQQDREASMALEKLRVDQALGVSGINSNAYTATSQARGNLVSGVGSALAAMSDEEKKTDIADGENRTDKFLKGFSTALRESQKKDTKDPWAGHSKMGDSIGKGIGALMGMGKGASTGAASAAAPAAAQALPAAAAAVSDENKKTDIKQDTDKLEAFVRALSNSEYKYKDPANGEGVHVSPMAQELEKSELGKSLVMDTPEGKVVNYAKAGGLMLATASMLNDKIDDLDTRLAAALKNRKGG